MCVCVCVCVCLCVCVLWSIALVDCQFLAYAIVWLIGSHVGRMVSFILSRYLCGYIIFNFRFVYLICYFKFIIFSCFSYLLFASFSHQLYFKIFYLSLSDSKFPLAFRTLLIIQTDVSSAVFQEVSVFLSLFSSSNPFSRFSGTFPRALNMIVITITFLLQSCCKVAKHSFSILSDGRTHNHKQPTTKDVGGWFKSAESSWWDTIRSAVVSAARIWSGVSRLST